MDYDYKKKRLGKIPDEEVKQAVEKFEESKELAERSMFNFLENDVSCPPASCPVNLLEGRACLSGVTNLPNSPSCKPKS